jgi:hypothetical protein
LPEIGGPRGQVDVGEGGGRLAEPGRAGEVGRFGIQLKATGGLVVAPPQAGGRPQVRAAQLVLGKTKQQAIGAAGLIEGVAQ